MKVNKLIFEEIVPARTRIFWVSLYGALPALAVTIFFILLLVAFWEKMVSVDLLEMVLITLLLVVLVGLVQTIGLMGLRLVHKKLRVRVAIYENDLDIRTVEKFRLNRFRLFKVPLENCKWKVNNGGGLDSEEKKCVELIFPLKILNVKTFNMRVQCGLTKESMEKCIGVLQERKVTQMV